MDVDSLLEGMRKLLVESSQEEGVLALMEQLRATNYNK